MVTKQLGLSLASHVLLSLYVNRREDKDIRGHQCTFPELEH